MASLEVGIVGLPNSGKTSLFNALTESHAEITSYAAVQASANVGIAAVPDDDFGSVRMQGVVPRFVGTPGEVRHSGGGIGADNEDVYINVLGLTKAELEQLKSEGIV